MHSKKSPRPVTAKTKPRFSSVVTAPKPVVIGPAPTFASPRRSPKPSAAAPVSATLIAPPPSTALPVINSPASATAQCGRPMLFQVTAAHGPATFSAAGLPTGLTIDPTTGIISGDPHALGRASVTLKAQNAHGASFARLDLTVN